MEGNQTKYEHTDKLMSRRKALFPCDDNDSDLGVISTINSDSNSSFPDINALDGSEACEGGFTCLRNNIDDYILLDEAAEASPLQTLITSPLLYSPQLHPKALTPLQKSPSSSLKTPHDTSTVKVNAKQPKRRLQDDSEAEDASKAKLMKLEASASKPKVRTALFPDDGGFSKVKTTSMYLCNRRSRSQRRYGQINAGVRHKIRKPRPRKNTRANVKAALSLVDDHALRDYMKVIATFNSTAPKQIVPLRETSGADKENRDPEVVIAGDADSSNKKFFKTKRTKGIVRINSRIKINVEKGKYNLLPEKGEYDDDGMQTEPSVDITEILNVLDSDDALKEKSELLLSPTSQMCDMASGLALDSPKRAKLNITSLLDARTLTNRSSLAMERQKLFPVFYMENRNSSTGDEKKKQATVAARKPLKKLPENQLLLDAGQKRFGLKECHECKMVYHMGDSNDEIRHNNYHNATSVLKYNGWKNERIVGAVNDGKIIKIVPGDSKIWWKKVQDLMEVVNRDLGYYESVFNTENSQVYLYIKRKQIIGCLIAEHKTTAHEMLSSPTMNVDLCSEASYPIKCGVSRIWVSNSHRRNGVGSAMLNTLRTNFMYGNILSKSDVALSAPTEQGKAFAKKYFGRDNFLIYM